MDDRIEITAEASPHRVRLLMESERTVAETAMDRAHQRSDRITSAVMALRDEPASWFYKPKDARRWIRAARDPAPAAAREVGGLVRAIAGAIDAHRQAHPGTTWAAVGEALEQALSFSEDEEDARRPSAS
jgi:hypothetical protein